MGSSYVPGPCEETQCIPQVWVFLAGTGLELTGIFFEGEITLGNIMEILPFDDPTVVLELDGESLWDALEEALSKYPAQEGQAGASTFVYPN